MVLIAPLKSKAGEHIKIEGITWHDPNELCFGNNAYEHTIGSLEATDDGLALYEGTPLTVSAGEVQLRRIRIPHNELRLKRIDPVAAYLNEKAWETMDDCEPEATLEYMTKKLMKRHKPPQWKHKDKKFKTGSDVFHDI